VVVNERVLVADDEPSVHEVARAYLEREDSSSRPAQHRARSEGRARGAGSCWIAACQSLADV